MQQMQNIKKDIEILLKQILSVMQVFHPHLRLLFKPHVTFLVRMLDWKETRSRPVIKKMALWEMVVTD